MARGKVTAEELLAQARSKGYKRGGYIGVSKHIEETKKDQDSALDHYVLLGIF